MAKRTEYKEYRLHVQGQIHGLVSSDYKHTYVCSHKPSDMAEVRKIAEEFQSIQKVFVEEVTTSVQSVLVPIEGE